MSFVDASNGWIVGDSGLVERTTDGGFSWTKVPSGIPTRLQCVRFADALNGWAAGSGNTIGRTTDGGRSWEWIHPAGDSGRTFIGISMADRRTGWVVGNYSTVLRTDDGGKTWAPRPTGSQWTATWTATAVWAVSTQEAWTVTTNREVYHTVNGGNNWTLVDFGNLGSWPGGTLLFTDIAGRGPRVWIATNAMASSIAHAVAPVIMTTDGGMSWAYSQSTETMAINAVSFPEEEKAWAAALGGILSTTDGGRTWTQVVDARDQIVVDVCSLDSAHGWAVTYRGDVYRCRPL